MDDGQPDGLRYTAFLSYSHKDAAAAQRLHRRLETYQMPKRLVGTESACGPVPARLAPIFRDREELPAATDLSETVREALARSGALIVLCSPAAAASLWVAEEIETFRRIHPESPVLAAVLEGDPPDCFPQALRAFGQDGAGHEPLATDLRRHRDGRRLGLLKLVAGITGVGLDALVQRDAARRIRRVTTVTGAALVAMLAMAALALVATTARGDAERQRAEAERQRVEAEGLVEFMLTDLRRELRSVGRLDIMSAVNQRVLSYYDRQQARGGARRQNLAVRARVDQTMGEDLLTRGDADSALRLFRQAHQTTAALIDQYPDDPEIIFVHAQSEYWVGRVYEVRRDWPPAQRQYSLYAALTDRLIATAPDNPEYMMQIAWAAIDLGNVQLRGAMDAAGAQRSYERAVHWFGRAVQARPQDIRAQMAQANAYAWLADSFYAREMWRQSLDARLRQYRIVDRLFRANPANVELGYRLAVAQRAVGVSMAKVGDLADARRLLLQAYAWSLRLTRSDPGNAEWLLFKGLVGCDLYHRRFDRPAGVPRDRLENEVRAVKAALDAQHNPHAPELSNCVNAMN
jgi:tetratricopeptide (TPR) repeat protein